VSPKRRREGKPKVIVFTGASADAGRAVARGVERVGGRALVLSLEASDAEAVERAAERAVYWAAHDERAPGAGARPWAATRRGLFALAGAGLLLGAVAARLLLAVRAQHLSDTQVERFRERGLL
jgi:hypothetical protein